MELRGERVLLRSLTGADRDWVLALVRQPAVAEWWTGYDAEKVQRELIDAPDGEWLGVELEGEPIGVAGFWEVPTAEYRRAGLGVALHPDWHGRGLGAEALGTLARWLVRGRGHHLLTIDPAVDNERAIRCYESVGFRPVGVMRRYERLPGGDFRDALLMDLLAEDVGGR